MVNKADHETYRGLVYVLCDKYMIAADPKKLNIRVNIDRGECKYVEIKVAILGFHIYVYNKYDMVSQHSFLQNLGHVVKFLDILS